MNKNTTKCNETLSKWCKNKHGASKIIDTLETYQHLFKNAPLNPSGPGDLSVAIFFTISSISSTEKGLSRL
jgi:hypothetical protein